MRARALRLGDLQVECLGPEQGPLVVGLPGLSANLRAFDLLAERCASAGLRFAALDLRGRGLSQDTGAGTYGWPRHARDVVHVARILNAPHFSVIPARGRKTVDYVSFLAGVPAGFDEVGDIRCAPGEILIRGRGGKAARGKVRLPAGGITHAD